MTKREGGRGEGLGNEVDQGMLCARVNSPRSTPVSCTTIMHQLREKSMSRRKTSRIEKGAGEQRGAGKRKSTGGRNGANYFICIHEYVKTNPTIMHNSNALIKNKFRI